MIVLGSGVALTAGAAPYLVSSATWQSADGVPATTHYPTMPTGIEAGDLLISITSSNLITPSATGWTLLFGRVYSTYVEQNVMYKIAEGSDTMVLTTANVQITGIMLCVRNADIIEATHKSQAAQMPTNAIITLPSGKTCLGVATASVNSTMIPDAYPSGGEYESPLIVNALNSSQDGSYAVVLNNLSGTDWTPTGFTNGSSIGWVLGTIIAYMA